MKSIKFLLATLVVSAMFASCAKEEMIVAPETQNGEFVGAELIGSNLAVNFTADNPSTKVTGGEWDSSDLLGLGWVLSKDKVFSEVQTSGKENAPTLGDLYANHMFQLNSNSYLSTKGNIYAGWHFGYYPFQYDEQLGDALKTFAVNAPQTAVTSTDEIVTSALHLSPLRFLSAKDLDKNYELKEGAVYPMFNVVKTIKLTVKPSTAFAASETLKKVKITGVTITATEDLFPKEKTDTDGGISVDVTKLYVDTTTVAHTYKKDTTRKYFYEKMNTAPAVCADMVREISTEVKCDDITLGADQVLRINTLPIKNTNLDSTSFVIKVHTVNGYYEVKAKEKTQQYTPTAVEAANNAELTRIANAYGENGALSAWNLNEQGEYRARVNFSVAITPDMFVEDFQINTVDQWNEAVAFVNASGLKDVDFTLAKDIKFTSNILLPDSAKLCVIGSGKIILDGATAWAGQTATDNKFDVQVPVEVAKDITVNGLMSADKITNKAVITAGATADIKGLDNTTNGCKVIVAYGAKVNTTAGGVIAYEVSDVTADGIAKINMLIDKSSNGNNDNIEVNTLIVKTALDLGAVATPSIDGSYGSTSAVILKDLSEVDIILEGGSLVGNVDAINSANTRVKVKSVTAKSGNTAITNVSLNSHKLDVSAGKLTATDVNFCEEDIVTVAEGAELIIAQSTGKKNLNDIASLDVEGKATVSIQGLTVNNVNVEGQLTVSDGSYLVHKNSSQVTGSVAGVFKPAATDFSTLNAMITLAKYGETLYLGTDVTANDVIEIAKGKNITINLNGKGLTTSSVNNNNQDDIIVKGTLTVKNGNVKTANTAFYADGGDLTLTDCVVTTDESNGATLVSVVNKGTLNISGGSYTGNVCNSNYDRYIIGVKAESNATINTTVKGGNGGVTVIGSSTANLTGGSYTGVRACGLYVAGGSTVTYSSNCTFSGIEGNVVVGGGEYGKGTVNGTTYNEYTEIQ